MLVIEMPIKVIPLERKRDDHAAWQQNTSRRPESQARVPDASGQIIVRLAQLGLPG